MVKTCLITNKNIDSEKITDNTNTTNDAIINTTNKSNSNKFIVESENTMSKDNGEKPLFIINIFFLPFN